MNWSLVGYIFLVAGIGTGMLAYLLLICASVQLRHQGPLCSWCRELQGYPPLPRGISSTICHHHHRGMLSEAEAGGRRTEGGEAEHAEQCSALQTNLAREDSLPVVGQQTLKAPLAAEAREDLARDPFSPDRGGADPFAHRVRNQTPTGSGLACASGPEDAMRETSSADQGRQHAVPPDNQRI